MAHYLMKRIYRIIYFDDFFKIYWYFHLIWCIIPAWFYLFFHQLHYTTKRRLCLHFLEIIVFLFTAVFLQLLLHGAGNRGRTCTVSHRILNPARLPIPPCPQMNNCKLQFAIYLLRCKKHCLRSAFCMVDVKELESLTTRTSSECSTS